MMRYFRCLQEKEARQTARKAVQKGRRKNRERGGGAGLGSDRPGWPGRASTPTSESDHRRGKFGSRQGRIRAASLLGGRIARGDHVRPTTSRGLNSGGWRAESGDKIKWRVKCSSGRGRGEKGSFIVAKRRVARCPIGRAKPEEAAHRQRFYKENHTFEYRDQYLGM
jgi:hypothetical protein